MTAALARLRASRPFIGYHCPVVVAEEPCCMEVCDGHVRRRYARLSRLRWVLVGRCGQHGGRL